jgi:DNA-binding winged helix-turn-helix (wHTH) protein
LSIRSPGEITITVGYGGRMIFADFGPLAVEVDGLPNPVSGRRLASVLAVLLARAGEVVTPAALVDAVWGAAAPERASQSLESLVWRLRKLLEPERTARQTPSVLRTEEHGYRLAVPPDSVESHLFVAVAESLPARRIPAARCRERRRHRPRRDRRPPGCGAAADRTTDPGAALTFSDPHQGGLGRTLRRAVHPGRQRSRDGSQIVLSGHARNDLLPGSQPARTRLAADASAVRVGPATIVTTATPTHHVGEPPTRPHLEQP